jgi:CubicO group peptidase (beta-lactamase class C family)
VQFQEEFMNETMIRAVLAEAVDRGAIAGAVVAVTSADRPLLQIAAGRQSLNDGAPMRLDSVFWIASMTKALTTVATLQLVEQGKLSLNQPIGEILPDLAAPMVLTGFDAGGAPVTRPAKTAITLKHLLTHTSGFSYEFANADLARYLAATGTPSAATGLLAGLRQPLMFEPGEAWEYGIGIDWAGQAVEAVSGLKLDAYFQRYITGPLGMEDTGFRPPAEQAPRRAAMHKRMPDGTLAVIPFEPRPAPEFLAGGAGLYSTAPDYLAFMRMILNNGADLLTPETIAAMSTNQIGALRAGEIGTANPELTAAADFYPGMASKWGYGFLLNPDKGPFGRSAGSLAWAGLPNCYYWIDPAKGLGAVILMQVLPSGDLGALKTFAGFESALYASL